MSHKTRVVPVNLPHVTYTKAFMYSKFAIEIKDFYTMYYYNITMKIDKESQGSCLFSIVFGNMTYML